jgi:hypothetical protein
MRIPTTSGPVPGGNGFATIKQGAAPDDLLWAGRRALYSDFLPQGKRSATGACQDQEAQYRRYHLAHCDTPTQAAGTRSLSLSS